MIDIFVCICYTRTRMAAEFPQTGMRSTGKEEFVMGPKKPTNYNDIDNLTDATNNFYSNQMKASGKRGFVFRDIWDMFSLYIVIAIAVVMFGVGFLVGWICHGKSDGSGSDLNLKAENDSVVVVVNTPALADSDTDSKAPAAVDSEPAATTPPEDSEPGDTPPEETTTPPSEGGTEGTVTRRTAATTRNAGNSGGNSGGGSVQTQPPAPVPSYTPTPVRTTARPAANTTPKATTQRTVSTTAKPAPDGATTLDNGSLSAELKRIGTPSPCDEGYRTTFAIYLTDIAPYTLQVQNIVLNIPSGYTIRNSTDVTNGSGTLSGTKLTIHCPAPMLSGETKMVKVILTGPNKLTGSNVSLRAIY